MGDVRRVSGESPLVPGEHTLSIARDRMAIGLCIALIASGVALGTGVASAAGKNCMDFPTQSAAQSYFDANGGSATNNVDGLDRDHDGVACEGNPTTGSAPSAGGTDDDTLGTDTSGTDESGTDDTDAGTTASNKNCRDFPDQPAAQAFLESDPSDPSNLDGDNDGMACDDYFRDAGSSTGDDGSTAATSGSQVSVVPEGSADTGSW